MAAEQTVNSVASAVTGELIGRALSGLIGKFRKQQATVDEKLQRLEMLLIKIHSAVEASEKHTVENTWLIRWRDKLKQATSEGDQVLASFRLRASDAQAAGNANTPPHNGASSSTTSTGTAALSFTRIALSGMGMAQGIHSARMMLFLFSSEDAGMKRLNATVEKLGLLSADIGEFVRLLQLEVLQATQQKQLDQKTENNVEGAAQVDTSEAPSPPHKKVRLGRMLRRSHRLSSKPRGRSRNSSAMVEAKTEGSHEDQRRVLVYLLRRAFPAICTAVRQAENRSLNDREWLASWADILREAERQGRAVLRATRPGKVPTVEFDQENDELCRFVQSMESLVRDVGHFSALASLCPSY
ncbi:hypothetical protein PVAP13_9KG387826 [Panicum virgatum]|uniref:Rx N-terminal domain-containing protein n=1 Tax=Panicum virgatum TaxID=38727 RepID=A0A8T0N5X0_PANVG|nr:hypothetical protein PVAP13_9KG387826 [Panicum virgatum]